MIMRRLISKYILLSFTILASTFLGSLGPSSESFAGANNTFSGTFMLGDSYAPNHYRLSIFNFDVGLSDISEFYAGSRLWKENYYAGFGVGSKGVMYGMVGYEWRFLPWAGLTYEFDGVMSVRGDAVAKVYLGIVAGW